VPEVADREQREARALGRRGRVPARCEGGGSEACADPEERRREQERGGAALAPRPQLSAPPLALSSRVKVTKAIAGRFEASRIANWIVSSVQPFPVHSFRMRSSSTSETSLVSTTL
jgi:hypothetical protein